MFDGRRLTERQWFTEITASRQHGSGSELGLGLWAVLMR